LLLPVYAGYLAPTEFGILDILTLLMMVGGIITILELGNAAFRFYFDNESSSYRKSVISTAIVSLTLNGAAIFFLFYFFSAKLSLAIFDSPAFASLLTVSGIYIFLNALITIPVNLLRIKDRPIQFTIVSSVQILISVLGIFAFVVFMKMGVEGVIWAKTVAIIPALAACLYLGRNDIGINIDLRLLKDMLKYSLPLIPASVAIWGINGLNRIFMLHYLSLDQIGLYSMGSKFAVIITLSVIAFQLAWPQYSLANMKSENSSDTFARIFNVVSAAGVWLVMGVTFFAGTFIRLTMNSNYYPSADVVLPLSLGMFMYGIFYFFSTGSVFAKTTLKIIPPIALAVVCNLILNPILTPRFGFYGTSWVTFASYTVMAVTMILATRKYEYIAFQWKKLALLGFISAATFALALNVGGVLMLPTRAVLIAAFPVILWKFRIFQHISREYPVSVPDPNKTPIPKREEICAE